MVGRLLAREGLNAEQLARDLKSFELKVEDFIRLYCCKFVYRPCDKYLLNLQNFQFPYSLKLVCRIANVDDQSYYKINTICILYHMLASYIHFTRFILDVLLNSFVRSFSFSNHYIISFMYCSFHHSLSSLSSFIYMMLIFYVHLFGFLYSPCKDHI